MKRKLTSDLLHALLAYDPQTGIFTNLIDRHHTARRGECAGSQEPRGYVRVSIGKKKYYAHRLAWLYMTGEWPTDQVDHADGNRANNAWGNLRECSNKQNQANRKMTSRSGLKGVTWHDCGKWMAQIMVNKKHIYLGLFDDAVEAHAAYCESARSHFGEFANFGESSPLRNLA